MTITAKLEPTAQLRWVMRGKERVLQQWWSNEMNVRMGPVQMVKGEWRDVPMGEE